MKPYFDIEIMRARAGNEEAGQPIDNDKGLFAASKTYGEVVRYHRPLPGFDVYGR
jgi:hypothetical protein